MTLISEENMEKPCDSTVALRMAEATSNGVAAEKDSLGGDKCLGSFDTEEMNSLLSSQAESEGNDSSLSDTDNNANQDSENSSGVDEPCTDSVRGSSENGETSQNEVTIAELGEKASVKPERCEEGEQTERECCIEQNRGTTQEEQEKDGKRLESDGDDYKEKVGPTSSDATLKEEDTMKHTDDDSESGQQETSGLIDKGFDLKSKRENVESGRSDHQDKFELKDTDMKSDLKDNDIKADTKDTDTDTRMKSDSKETDVKPKTSRMNRKGKRVRISHNPRSHLEHDNHPLSTTIESFLDSDTDNDDDSDENEAQAEESEPKPETSDIVRQRQLGRLQRILQGLDEDTDDEDEETESGTDSVTNRRRRSRRLKAMLRRIEKQRKAEDPDIYIDDDDDDDDQDSHLGDYIDLSLFDEESDVCSDEEEILVECPVCVDEYPEEYLVKRRCCETLMCWSCWQSYLSNKVTSGVLLVPCPGVTCSQLVPEAEVSEGLDYEDKKLFFKLVTDASNNPTTRTCPRCSTVTTVEESALKAGKDKAEKKGLQVTCADCQLLWCFPCHAPWHEGLTCREFLRADRLFLQWTKEKDAERAQINARCCPRCHIFVQRSEGCPHMNCSRCGTDFCYDCGKRAFRGTVESRVPSGLRRVGRYVVGKHHGRLALRGCSQNLLPNHPAGRKLVRGSWCGAKVIGGVVLGTGALALVLGIGAVAVVVAGPVVGGVVAGRRLKRKVEEHRRLKAQEKEAKRSACDLAKTIGKVDVGDLPMGGEIGTYRKIVHCDL